MRQTPDHLYNLLDAAERREADRALEAQGQSIVVTDNRAVHCETMTEALSTAACTTYAPPAEGITFADVVRRLDRAYAFANTQGHHRLGCDLFQMHGMNAFEWIEGASGTSEHAERIASVEQHLAEAEERLALTLERALPVLTSARRTLDSMLASGSVPVVTERSTVAPRAAVAR